MKVWVVTEDVSWDGPPAIRAVFSSKEKAAGFLTSKFPEVAYKIEPVKPGEYSPHIKVNWVINRYGERPETCPGPNRIRSFETRDEAEAWVRDKSSLCPIEGYEVHEMELDAIAD